MTKPTEKSLDPLHRAIAQFQRIMHKERDLELELLCLNQMIKQLPEEELKEYARQTTEMEQKYP